MRGDRVERAKENRDGLAKRPGAVVRFVRLEAFDGVEHLHAGRHHGVVLHATVVVLGLLQGCVDFAAQMLRVVPVSGVVERFVGGRANAFGVLVGPVPDAAQEPVRPFGTGIGPGGGLIGGTGEHHEAASRVGAVLLDDFARFNDVVLRF